VEDDRAMKVTMRRSSFERKRGEEKVMTKVKGVKP
jgi:hypothetical protein